jgi:hypothetical protein
MKQWQKLPCGCMLSRVRQKCLSFYINKDGSTFRFTAVVDTGAAISLFPRHFLDLMQYQITNSSIEIDQAGIAQQTFSAEATVTGFLEDISGIRTKNLQFKAWFAETDIALIGS